MRLESSVLSADAGAVQSLLDAHLGIVVAIIAGLTVLMCLRVLGVELERTVRRRQAIQDQRQQQRAAQPPPQQAAGQAVDRQAA